MTDSAEKDALRVALHTPLESDDLRYEDQPTCSHCGGVGHTIGAHF